VVEGLPDEAALKKICAEIGAYLGAVYGRNGKGYILSRINGYNNSARHRHWVVLVDLDEDFSCPGEAVSSWLDSPASLMCFRIAVRELEAWLIADRERLAQFLQIDDQHIPTNPDYIKDPKATLVKLAKMSRSRNIRDDMAPDPSTGASVGPAYTSRLIEYIDRLWRPSVAAEHSRSLTKCIDALILLIGKPLPV
jgi:hypothetical protein